MKVVKVLFSLANVILAVYLTISWSFPAAARGLAQIEPTATPQGSVPGAVIATITPGDEDGANVRSGPGTDYPVVGRLPAQSQVPALGKSPGGDWVKVVFAGGTDGTGWVYAYLVQLSGALPVVEPPATPTPKSVPTIDPTLAAQFIVDIPPTRLPTFTPPPSLVIPTYVAASPVQNPYGTQMVYAMIGLVLLGVLVALASLMRTR